LHSKNYQSNRCRYFKGFAIMNREALSKKKNLRPPDLILTIHRERMWYTIAYVCVPATLCAPTPVRVYLARRQVLVPFTIGRAAAGVFGQSVCVRVYVCRDPSLFYISRSVPVLPRILFAYFVLRTRRIRSSHFRHVCLCSSTRNCIDGDVDATRSRFRTYLSGEVYEEKRCFPLLLARARELIYDSTIRLHGKLGVRVHRNA